MEINEIVCGIIKNNNFIVTRENKCLVIDLSEFKPIDDFITKNKLIVEGVLLTHTHWDHLLGVEEFIKKYKVPVYISSNRPNYIFDAGFDYTIEKYGFKTKFNPEEMEIKYLEQGKQNIKGFEFEVIDVPGHTTCSIIYYFNKEKTMFTGDFLFKGTIGVINTQLSNKRQMKESLEKIKTYPDTTKIYPGHGENTDLKTEKIYNSFLNRGLK